ncbi:MAG: peptidylprolyl isomerase, partial [Xanthomonadales bacterium]|nr:peptidylprolyl isomerase [Xanthomonadales bacterium]
LEQGAWTGPVPSGYGLHLVFIDAFEPAREPELSEVRDRVRNEWFAQRRSMATDALYEQLSQKYAIEIEPLGEAGQ